MLRCGLFAQIADRLDHHVRIVRQGRRVIVKGRSMTTTRGRAFEARATRCQYQPTSPMGNTADGTAGPMMNRRIDPALDRRRLVLFFAGLIVFYVGVLLITQPVLNGGEAELNKITYGVMLAPTVGAILACIFGPGLIRFGMPSWWILAGFLPAALVFLITMIAVPVSGAVTYHPEHGARLLLLAVLLSLVGCIPALGEEIGWRGFLWPLMRRRLTFLASTAIMFVIWWIYHAVLVFAGW
jgi:membrane protease YdiL (CAAX protease family)